MDHILILTHEHDQFTGTRYYLRAISEAWRASGIKVTVLRGPGAFIPADLAILHVDLTVIPRQYIEFAERYPVTLNLAVADISKRKISANLVHRGDGYNGAVIVKTNRNFGGGREAETSQKSIVRKYVRAIRRRLPWPFRAELGIWDYPIYDSPAQVPWAVWLNPDLVVEKLLSERRGEYYCLRSWIFLGDAERNTLLYAKQPIIKSLVAVKSEPAQVPDELRQMRRELKFDFGKFDYGIVDGHVVLYDANRTPTMGDPQKMGNGIENLAAGIRAFDPTPIKFAG